MKNNTQFSELRETQRWPSLQIFCLSRQAPYHYAWFLVGALQVQGGRLTCPSRWLNCGTSETLTPGFSFALTRLAPHRSRPASCQNAANQLQPSSQTEQCKELHHFQRSEIWDEWPRPQSWGLGTTVAHSTFCLFLSRGPSCRTCAHFSERTHGTVFAGHHFFRRWDSPESPSTAFCPPPSILSSWDCGPFPRPALRCS